MPLYDYKALGSDGRQKRGVIESDTVKNARIKLKRTGLLVTEIKVKTTQQPTQGFTIPFFGGRISIADLSLATRQMASLIKANIPLVEALNALVDQVENEKLKVTFAQVRQDVNEGSSLAKALTSHPKVFDTIFVNMVEAGENSGTLGLVLLKLADLKEAQLRLRNKVLTAMTYPILMLLVGSAMVLAVFTIVIPKLAKIFESSKKPVPMITQFMMWTSDFFVNYWMFIGAFIFGALFLFTNYIRTQTGKRKWDAFKLRMPVLGPLTRIICVTRFASTMGTLLGSGVPILTAMLIARNLVGNVLIEEAVSSARENITEGQSIAEPLRQSGQFPPLVIHMVAIGEKTGELSEMFRNVSETYEEQVNSKIESLTSLLEPIMIIVMGIFVAFVIISIFLPILDISNIQ